MIIALDGNVSRMPDINNGADKFHFVTKDESKRRGCRFSMACGYGDRRWFANVLVFDRESLPEGTFPDRFKHAATWLMFHANLGTRVSMDCRIEGETREVTQSKAGWGRSNTGSTTKQYQGMTFIPVGGIDIHEHKGERSLLTAIRRNATNPKVVALFNMLTEQGDEVERIGPQVNEVPPIWEQLSAVEAMRGDNENSTTTIPTGGSTPKADDDEDEEEIPF